MRIGADPEIFLCNLAGKHIAINGYINHGKENPLQIPDMPVGFTLQEDNVALEYGIPPASSSDEFKTFIKQVMEKSRSYLPADLSFSKLSCTVFEDDQLCHPLSRRFGCEPDYNAYTLEPNPSPMPRWEGQRSAGGHIHVETKLPPVRVVQSMDLHLGIPSILMDKCGKDRRDLYGKPGAFRYKSYGVEYRTLSNFWMFEDKYLEWVWRNTEQALTDAGPDQWPTGLAREVRKIIDTNNKKAAEALCKEYNLDVV